MSFINRIHTGLCTLLRGLLRTPPSIAHVQQQRSRTILLLSLAVLLSACSDSSDVDYLKAGPYAVGNISDYQMQDQQRNRQFDVSIWYPAQSREDSPETAQEDAVPAQDLARIPLVVYSHGFTGSAQSLTYLKNHLASHGFMVVSPNFPLTSEQVGFANVDVNDVINQPGDVSFIIDAALGDNDQFPQTLQGMADPQRVALNGFSLGGLTTLLASFDRELRDPRIKVTIPMGAAGGDFFLPPFYDYANIPMLLVNGDGDALVQYEANAVSAFANANSPTSLLTLEGGSHLGFSDGALNFPPGNPDALACQFFPAPDENDPDSFYLKLLNREPDSGIGEATAPLPCTYGVDPLEYMEVARQHDLIKIAVLAFLKSHLSSRTSERGAASHYLNARFAQENGDISLQQK